MGALFFVPFHPITGRHTNPLLLFSSSLFSFLPVPLHSCNNDQTSRHALGTILVL